MPTLPLLVCVITLGLVQGCVSTATQTTGAPPLQLPCLTLQQAGDKSLMFGHGQGQSLAQAKQQAYADLSEQLKVTVNSSSVASVYKTNAEVSTAFDQHIQSRSTATFSGLEMVCFDQHSKSGTVFVAMQLDVRPLPQRLVNSLIKQWPSSPRQINWQAPLAMTKSTLLRGVNNTLQNKSGTTEVSLQAQLFYDQRIRLWSLVINDITTSLEPEQLHTVVDWHSLAKGEARLAALSVQGDWLNTQISHETEYRLALQHPQGGYAQLLGLYENGDISLLRSNIQLPAGSSYIVPETTGVFEALALPQQKVTTDTLLLLVTPNRMASAALTRLGQNKNPAALQLLLAELEQLNGDIAVIQLVIQ